MSSEKLPWGWRRASARNREDQLSLWRKDRDTILAWSGVSLDDLERWRAKEWISFDASVLSRLDETEIAEIAFVRNIARSGLSDAQIQRFLDDLDRPYRYDPLRTAWSFAFGWVQIFPEPEDYDDDMDLFVRERLPEWIREKETLGATEELDALLDALLETVARMKFRGKDAKST